MIDENAKAHTLISGKLKRSASYHSAYGSKTYGEIRQLAARGDSKARQMKKLIEHVESLPTKIRRRTR